MANPRDIGQIETTISRNIISEFASLAKPIEEYLEDPNYSPSGEPSQIGDNDFTNATNDISKKGKKTLGIYLSDKTKRNSYPVAVASPNVFVDEESVSSDIGSSGLGVHTSDKKKNQSTFFSQKQLDDVFDKSSDNKNKNGHTLLSSIPYDGEIKKYDKGSEILQSIYENLKEGNLYNNNDKTFVSGQGKNIDDLSDEFDGTNGLFTVQRNFGEFDKNEKSVTAKELADKIAKILTSTSKNFAHNQRITLELLTDDQKSNLSKIYPWNTSNGLSAANQDWSSENMYSKDGFSGKSPGALEIVSQGYLVLLAHAIDTKDKISSFKKDRFVSLNDKQATLTTLLLNDNPDTSLLTYGKRESRRYIDKNDPNISQYYKFANLDYDFDVCFSKGISAFFGISESDEKTIEGQKNNLTTKIPNQKIFAESILTSSSPGFYLSILRGLTRSLTNEGDFELKGNESHSISESKIYKFVLTMAALGDVVLKSKIGMRDVTPTERLLTKEGARYVSPSVLALGIVVATNTDNKLAKDIGTIAGGALLGTFRQHVSRWSPVGTYDASPSANPLSLHTFYASQKTPPGVGLASTTPIGMRALKPTRENVEIIENALDSEYMPFYVHDLRTHEVISMPAFITSFGESFTPTYNSIAGIGRQDPVRIYQSTERSVSISFKLIAFNEEDFDHLWLTINKFVAMCYPQYSAGRARESFGKSFIQPFSQVQAASPMIRLRLGDVLKSNYSKFGVARLFGVNSSAISASKEEKEGIEGKVKEINKIVSDKLSLAGNVVSALALTAAKAAGNAVAVANATTTFAGERASQDLYDEGSDSQRVTNYISNNQANDIRTGVRTLLDKGLKYNQIAQVSSVTDTSMPDSSFYEAKNNAIVRSFESSRGRGVAGFITSLDLNYDDVTWETKFGKKAPKMVTINLRFTPITDLPLGLDYDGNMRNPSHPVGKFAGSFGDVYDNVTDLGTGIGAKDFNNSTLVRKIKSGQIAADVALSVAIAADDLTK